MFFVGFPSISTNTTRAALTGLRKKGHMITAGKVDGVTVYRIQPGA